MGFSADAGVATGTLVTGAFFPFFFDLEDSTTITITITRSSATVNPQAQKALGQIGRLRGSELHSSVMLCEADERILKKLGVNYTCEPVRRTKKLY